MTQTLVYAAAVKVGDPTASVLGVFGREGVDVASFWGFDSPRDPTAYVWRIYRNYDGKGGQFGDTSVDAASADAAKLGIYAAKRTTDGALTIVVINRTSAALTSTLTVAGFAQKVGAASYTYAAARPGAIVAAALGPIALSRYAYSYPADSVTLFAVR